MSDGANNYSEADGKLVWHLDGYLCAPQLNKLATLANYAEKAEKKDIKDADLTEVKTLETIEVEKEDGTTENKIVNLAETYKPYYEVMYEPIKVETDPVDWSGEVPTVNDPDEPTLPNVDTEPDPGDPVDRPEEPPVIITPPPVIEEPPVVVTPPTGGGGGGAAAAPAPVAEIADEATPLAELPEEVAEIAEEEVPLAELPAEEEAEIMDEEVPLADIPHTGDISAVWYLSALISAAGLAMLTFKRKEEGQEG